MVQKMPTPLFDDVPLFDVDTPTPEPEKEAPPAKPAPTPKAGVGIAATFDELVDNEIVKIKAREEARKRIAAERAAHEPPMDLGTLGEVLARPAGPPERVQGIIPADASTIVSAQRKTGKTTFCLNLIRSLLTGEPLLGQFDVVPVTGTIAFLNYEVSPMTLARWADDVGIDHDRLLLVNLRGKRNPLVRDEDRAQLAEILRGRGVETVIVDTFGRAFTGKNQNDVGEVIPFLVGLDEWVRTGVGATDLILTTHAGWNGERTRGSAGLEEWPDSIIRLTRDQDDDSQRFMSAMGRDVEIDEDRLDFDPVTRHLTMAGVGSRKTVKGEKKTADLAVLVAAAVRATPGMNRKELTAAIREFDDAPAFQDRDVSKAVTIAEKSGQVTTTPGPRRSTLHHPSEPSASSASNVRPGRSLSASSASYRDGRTQAPLTVVTDLDALDPHKKES